MLTVLAYCLRDYEITLTLLDWIEELGGARDHALLLCHDARVPENNVQAILDAARSTFKDVRTLAATAQIDGWPAGANYMFRLCTSYLAQIRGLKHFLWLEPDAIPLRKGWLEQLEQEYLAAKKPFMGDDVNVENIPRHMSGVAVYQNPIYNLAGEAYRAADTAWDMSARHQIVPNAHFTKLIEHAWRHPEFTSVDELTTQIRKEAMLFHASKDGSLIKLLRNNLNAVPVLAVPPKMGFPTSGEARESNGASDADASDRSSQEAKVTDSRGGVQTPVYDIFIRTYPVDYPWLQYCLRSIAQYATGFRKIWIVSPEPPVATYGPAVEWKILNEESPDGYLSQQIHKLYADHITGYEADYILHIDSDTLFTRTVTPEDFFTDDKLIWYYTPYEHTQTPWKPITEKFMGRPIENEFMRRLPMMVPKWLYPQLRQFCVDTHHKIISEYIRSQPYREFSEFNALGAYAWEFHKDKFEWVNTLEIEMPPPFARQFFSWGGLTTDVKEEIQQILSGTGEIKPGGLVEPVPSQNNGDITAGDRIRWIADWVASSPSRRQYVMRELKKHGLAPKRGGRKRKLTHA